ALKTQGRAATVEVGTAAGTAQPAPEASPAPQPLPAPGAPEATLRIRGTIPDGFWNRLGTRLLPKLRMGQQLTLGIEFSVTVPRPHASTLAEELRQALSDLGLGTAVQIEESGSDNI
ncbi:MAG: hypothetical protein ONB14_12645, partial [candidate division KSB1 bacterium]|nr:hypothetical protein [candidate division KSB1 bacterium]